jgi:hypothetical protein
LLLSSLSKGTCTCYPLGNVTISPGYTLVSIAASSKNYCILIAVSAELTPSLIFSKMPFSTPISHNYTRNGAITVPKLMTENFE